MRIRRHRGTGSSSQSGQAYVPPSDASDGADDSSQDANGNTNLLAMIEQLVQAIMKQLMSQMNPDSGGSSGGSGGGGGGGGGAPPVARAGGGQAAAGHRNAGGAQAGGAPPAPGQATSAGNGGSGASSNNALLNEINRVRTQAGLKPLTEKASLDSAAASNDQANVATGDLEHHNGLIDGSMGEITAANSGGETAEGAVQQWLNSPEHREIMMNPDYTSFGGSINGDFSTADFS